MEFLKRGVIVSAEATKKYKQLYHQHCLEWPDRERRRYLNIPNDVEDVDEEELTSAEELIEEVNASLKSAGK